MAASQTIAARHTIFVSSASFDKELQVNRSLCCVCMAACSGCRSGLNCCPALFQSTIIVYYFEAACRRFVEGLQRKLSSKIVDAGATLLTPFVAKRFLNRSLFFYQHLPNPAGRDGMVWREWCCRRMIEIKDDDDGCRPVGDVMLRLCRSLQLPPQPYHERA